MILHIPKNIQSKLSTNDCKAIDEDYDDYLSYGGSYTFKAWLAHYHFDIYITLYKD